MVIDTYIRSATVNCLYICKYYAENLSVFSKYYQKNHYI